MEITISPSNHEKDPPKMNECQLRRDHFKRQGLSSNQHFSGASGEYMTQIIMVLFHSSGRFTLHPFQRGLKPILLTKNGRGDGFKYLTVTIDGTDTKR